MYIYMISVRNICIGLLILSIIIIIIIKIKPFKFLEHFNMETDCNHCCINNDNKTECNQNCYQNGVVCECCKKYNAVSLPT